MLDNSTFLAHVVFVLGGHEKGLYGIVPLKMYLYAYFISSVPEFFTKSSYVWHYYICVLLLESVLLVALCAPLVAVCGSLCCVSC